MPTMMTLPPGRVAYSAVCMQISFPVHSNVMSTPSSSSSARKFVVELARASISAACPLAESSWLRKGRVLDGVIMPSQGVEVPEKLPLEIEELLDELCKGRGTT